MRKENQPPHVVKKALAQAIKARRPGESDRDWEARKSADAKTIWFTLVDSSQIVRRQKVASGSYGTTYKCHILGSSFIKDEPYCVKFQNDDVRLCTASADVLVRAMVKNMRESSMQVRHGAIIRCIGSTIGLERTGMIFPYWNGGSFSSFFVGHGDNAFAAHACKKLGARQEVESNVLRLEARKKKELFVARRVGDIAVTFCSALRKLHQERYLHMDLHPGNVLLHFDFGKEKGCTDPQAVYIGICDWGEVRLIGEQVDVKRAYYRGMDGAGKKKIEDERLQYPWMHDDLFFGPNRDGTRQVPARADFDLWGAMHFIFYLADFARRHSFLDSLGTPEVRKQVRTISDYLKHVVERPMRIKTVKFDLTQLLDTLRGTFNCSPTSCTRPQLESDWIPQVSFGVEGGDQAGPSNA